MKAPKPQVAVACEGPTDFVVAQRVLRHVGLAVFRSYPQGGKATLDVKLNAYNNAAKFSPWLVLRDLNSDAECPPSLVLRLLPNPSPSMAFRIVVRAIEAWLLSDSEKVADYFMVARSRVPRDPESLPAPKRAFIEMAGKSRSRAIRSDVCPDQGANVGPGYFFRLSEFTNEHWRPQVAAKSSRSLYRCIEALKRLKTGRTIPPRR